MTETHGNRIKEWKRFGNFGTQTANRNIPRKKQRAHATEVLERWQAQIGVGHGEMKLYVLTTELVTEKLSSYYNDEDEYHVLGVLIKEALNLYSGR